MNADEVKLFIGNLPNECGPEAVQHMLAPYNGVEVAMLKPKVEGGRGRFCASAQSVGVGVWLTVVVVALHWRW